LSVDDFSLHVCALIFRPSVATDHLQMIENRADGCDTLFGRFAAIGKE
jgi:hypothetical protein